jgi:predicted RecB family nuclease
MNPLTVIPGVGKSIAEDLNGIGITEMSELKDKDPEQLYQLICNKKGAAIDRCLLYVMRCAVYYASTENPEPAKFKWWNWKNRTV